MKVMGDRDKFAMTNLCRKVQMKIPTDKTSNRLIS